MKMEQTVCSETSAYNIQTPGNCPEESIKQDTRLWRWNRQCVPKCRHTTFRRRGITQKKVCTKMITQPPITTLSTGPPLRG